MQNESIPRLRAIQALNKELVARNSIVSATLLQQIYELEERVQYDDGRGQILLNIEKLIQGEIDKGDGE